MTRKTAARPRHAESVQPATPSQAGGWRRHLEGWQPAAIAVLLAGSAALVAVPRPVEPVDLPEPHVDSLTLARLRSVDRDLAASAEREGLDADARALGSALREYGRADADDDPALRVEARARVVDAFGLAMRVVPDHVLRLRAWQLAAFVREVRRWEATGVESSDLRELAGGFLRALRRSDWVEESSDWRRVKMDEPALVALFKKRWTEVVGATGPGFDLEIDEQRALYRFLLRHPPKTAIPFGETPPARFAEGDAETRAREGAARAYLEQYRLKKLDELAAIDPGFPADLARGVVLYRLGRYPAAVEKFRLHLERSPDGPFTLRAQNYLRAALGRVRDEAL